MTIRDLVQEHLRALVALLSGFILASIVVLLADVPVWSRVVAACLAVVSLLLVAAWLNVPWVEWRAKHGWRIAAVAAPAVSAIAVLVLGMTAWKENPPAIPTDPATLILVDSSEGMADGLEGGGSKFQEAAHELERNARDLGRDQLGLASFGVADCNSESAIDELVPIGPRMAARIRETAAELEPAGRSNLVSAARNALGVLNSFEGGARLLVITAGLDDCGGELAELIAESEIKDVPVQWELVGLGLSSEEKAELAGLGGEVRVHLADSSDQLDEIFRLVLFEEPIRDELRRLTEYVQTDIAEPLRSAGDAIDARPPRPQAVREQVAVLRERAAEGDERFDEFATEAEREVFAPVKSLLKEQFELLQEAAAKAEAVAAFDEEHDRRIDDSTIPARNELVNAASAPVTAYNDNLNELGERIEAALEQLFAPG